MVTRKRSSLKQDEMVARLVSLPAVLTVVLLVAIPFAIIVIQSFREVGFGTLLGTGFVGLTNYVQTIANPFFRRSIAITLVFSVCTVAFTYVIGFYSAVFLNDQQRFKKLIFALCLLPWAMPLVPTGLIWRWMLHRNYGVLNWLVFQVGLSSGMLDWFGDRTLAMISIIASTVWRQYPIGLLMIYAAIQTIPQDYFDVGRVAGVNKRQEIRHIIFPGVLSVSSMLVIVQLLDSFRAVTTIFVLTGGGPLRATETLALYTFIEAFEFYNFDRAAAAGVLTLFIIMSIVVGARRLLRRTI
ncbi:MAG: sugar ABC transporter permease [Spirochaetaceae bacterium]|nr:MAG: sugar ABC transporter permease [Spirochaetaceae bacterium]